MTGKTVKEAAKILGVPKSTLRYYDKIDLLKPSREDNGYRVYQKIDLLMIKYILVMKYGEFNLEEMQTLLGLISDKTTTDCREKTEKLIKAKKKLFQDKIDYYQQMVSLFEKVPEIKDLNDEEERAIDSYVEQIYHMISTPGVIIQ